MNIFYINKDPETCATWMVDKHVVKMILESAQILSTAHRVLDYHQTGLILKKPDSKRKTRYYSFFEEWKESLFYKATHVNHKSCIWARSAIGNYAWLHSHLNSLSKEYTYRFGKIHKVEKSGLLSALSTTPKNLIHSGFYDPPSCMDAKYIIGDDAVENYRNYYNNGKQHIHKWTKRDKPYWIE